jgi:hypothetical protein
MRVSELESEVILNGANHAQHGIHASSGPTGAQ